MPDGTESTVASQVVGPFLLTLNEMWAEWFGSEGVPFHALHPGWADTPGIEDAHGQFWLDRRRSIHKLGRTRSSDTPERRQQLWEIVVEVAGLDPATAG